MGPADYGPGEAVGAPDHPHRGFETVTYMLEGEFEHEDSAGHRGVLAPGDVQWMTAGRGVVHSEMPSRRIREQGGRVHGFQIWVNLPAREKMMPPRYQEVPAAGIPEGTAPDGLARVRVIAGEALGVRAVIDTRTPILYQDWSLRPGAVRGPAASPTGGTRSCTCSKDARRSAATGARSSRGSWACSERATTCGSSVPAGSAQGARLLLLGGQPLREPVARYGPFVMNTEAEIRQAVTDYQAGRLGQIER